MLEFLTHYWLEVVLSGALSIVTYFVKKQAKEYKAIKAGMTAILRDRIVQAYYHYEGRNSITLHGLENVNAMFEEYKNLGGNGSVKKLVHDLNELDVVDK